MKKTILVCIALAGVIASSAQTQMTLEECEQLFIKNNLLLLAEQYNIDASKANVIQAKIWEQPYISGEINAFNPNINKPFDIGKQGQKALAIQQLIKLGGKKKNEIALAKSNVHLAELQFEQLLKNLKYQLHQHFYTLHFDLQKIQNLNQQVTNVDSLANAYAVQAAKNNIALKDVVRLQSLSLNFKSDLISIQKEINDEEENLKLITGSPSNITPSVSTSFLNDLYKKRTLLGTDELLKIALEKNPEYLSFLTLIENNELMLKWQKSLSVPDLTLGASYDQRGGAFNNQTNLTFGVPLPLWNKNKGNIRIAKAQLNEAQIQKEYKILELKNKIETAFQNWQQQQKQYLQIEATDKDNFITVYSGILTNFQKRNISLLEFTDFMESYNQSILVINEMQKQLILSCEILNQLTNEKIF
jgi:cobalt-zinc-cadmium efflux system outer membrane protein